MNERIKDLYARAVSNRFPEGEEEVYMSPADLEKFAELIVKECVALVEKQDHGTSELRVSQWDGACRAVSKDIKEHFGVEE